MIFKCVSFLSNGYYSDFDVVSQFLKVMFFFQKVIKFLVVMFCNSNIWYG